MPGPELLRVDCVCELICPVSAGSADSLGCGTHRTPASDPQLYRRCKTPGCARVARLVPSRRIQSARTLFAACRCLAPSTCSKRHFCGGLLLRFPTPGTHRSGLAMCPESAGAPYPSCGVISSPDPLVVEVACVIACNNAVMASTFLVAVVRVHADCCEPRR